MRRVLVAAAVLAALAGCQRESQPSAAARVPQATAARSASAASNGSNTAAMGAGPAASAPSFATPTSVAMPPNADVGAGRTIATQGHGAAAACVGCHGANGEGNAQAGFPRLAGLGRIYIEHQLNSYADGSRTNAVMQPIAAALDAQQRAAVAAFYAGLASAPAAGNKASANASPPVLVARGDERRGIQGCANCHGPGGIGDAAANPYLAGQGETYLVNAMAEWKGGARRNDPSGQMPAIAKALSDAEAKQLAAYFAALPPPAPRNAQAAAVAVNSSRPAVQSGPVAPTAPSQGTGTQQGAPLMGGAQGQGSGGAATNPQQTAR